MFRMHRLLLSALILCTASLAAAQTPGAPTNLTAVVEADQSLTLTWMAPTTGGTPTAYLVRIGTSPGAADVLSQQIGTTTTYVVSSASIPAGTLYIRVHALNPSGISPPSNEVTVTVTCVPPTQAPGGVTWRATGSAVELTWELVPGATDYQIEVGTAPGLSDVSVSTVGSSVRTFATVPLPVPGTYYVRVRGLRECGAGTPSSEVVVTATTPMPVPSTSIVINEFSTFVELRNASAAAVNVGGWRIHTSTGSDQITRRVATLPAGTMIAPGCTYLLAAANDPLTSGMAADHPLSQAIVDGVAVVRGNGMIVDAAGRRNSFDPTFPDTPYVEGQALPARRDTMGVESFARAGDDTDNNAADFIPLTTANPQNAATCLGTVPPGAPINLTVAVSVSTVTLSWTPPAGGGTVNHYRLEAGSAPGLADLATFDLSRDLTSVMFGSVANGTYYVRVRAANSTGLSAPSNEVAVVVCGPGCVTPPGPVTQLTFQVSDRNVLLEWNAPASGPTPTGYVIEAGTASGLADIGQFSTGSTATFAIVSSVPPGTYYVRVRALNGSALGPPSNQVVIVVP